MKEQKTTQSHDFELSTIPDSHRNGFWSMFVIMMGFTFFSASMWAGGSLGAGLSLKDFFIAVLIGNLILGVYTGLLAWIAARTRLSVHLLSRYSFGNKGSYIPSAVLAFTQIGWFGVGIAMFAIPVAMALKDLSFVQDSWLVTGPQIKILFDGVSLPSHLLYSLVFLSGILMTSTAYWGIRALKIISLIAVPSIAVFGCYSVFQALFVDHPDSIGEAVNGFEYVQTHIPAKENALGLTAAITIAVGSFISGGTCTPDFARFSKSSKTAIWTTVLAFFIGNSLMFFMGAAGAMVHQQSDISMVLKLQGLLVPAILVLGLNIWTTNDNALYTSGLGLSNIFKLPKKYLVIVNGIIGTLMAVWLYDNFCNWLNILNIFIPPIGAILIVDYFILNKAKYQEFEKNTFVEVNMPAVVAWLLGSFIALIGSGKIAGFEIDFLSKGLPAINGMIVAIVVYVCLKKMMIRNKKAQL